MAGGKVCIALDTMVFLHFEPVPQLRLAELVSASTVTLLVPLVTLNELDKHKDEHRVDKIRERARTRLAELEQWVTDGQAAPSVAVEFIAARPSVDFGAHGLQPSRGDDQLIATLWQYAQDHPGVRLVLVTEDTGLRLRCGHFGIEPLSADRAKRLAPVEDELVKENRELQAELMRMQTAQPRLSLMAEGQEDGHDFVAIELTSADADSAKEKDQTLQNLRDKHPERHPASQRPDPGAGTIDGISLAHISSLISIQAGEFERYNHDRLEYFTAMSSYYDQLAAYEGKQDRTFVLRLMVRNTGTSPADDVDIAAHFPDGFDLYEASGSSLPPTEPSPPQPPRSRLDMQMPRLDVLCSASSLGLPGLPKPDPFRLRRTNSFELTDHVGRIKHEFRHIMKPLYVVFPSYADASSFCIRWRISAANLPGQANGTLNVAITKQDL